MFGDTFFIIMSAIALVYLMARFRRYMFFYPVTDGDGFVHYDKRSSTRYMAVLPPSKAKIKNHESAEVDSIRYRAYAEVD